MYSCIKQYMAIETDTETTRVIYEPAESACRLTRLVESIYIDVTPSWAPRILAVQASVVQNDRGKSGPARSSRQNEGDSNAEGLTSA